MSAHPARQVLVAASAFGADVVREHGHAWLLPTLTAAGADGIEVRRELMDGIPLLADLAVLCKRIATHDLFCVYSAPVELWRADGKFALWEMQQVMAQAVALEARFLKVSLGFYSAECSDSELALLASFIDDAPVEVLLENDQTPQGGRLAPIAHFLNRCEAAGIAFGMTFDIGNWRWQQGDADDSAAVLGRFVRYVHCKDVHDTGKKLNAVPLAANDPRWRKLFAQFDPAVPRAIEFPLIGDDLVAVTRGHIEVLKQY